MSAIVEKSATMWISHGLATAGREYLAELWDKPENWDADNKPGSFGAYLRDAADNLEQRRVMTTVRLPDMRPNAHLVGAVLDVEGVTRQEGDYK